MKTITVVYDGAKYDTTALVALILSTFKSEGIEARAQDGADLAQFTDDEVEQAARDRGFTFAHDL